MSRVKIYKLRRAIVQLTDTTNYEIRNITHRMVYNEIKQNLARLQSPDTTNEDARQQLKERIRDLRGKLRRHRKTRINVKIKLTDPRYFGHETSYDLEYREFDRLSDLIKDYTNNTIRHFRTLNPPTGITVRAFLGGTTERMGSVFANSNSIYKAYVHKFMKDLYAEKRPTDQEKHLGIELEFCAPISEEDLCVKLFKAGLQKVVQLKEDGSLRPKTKERGYELAILLKEASYKKDLKNILDILSSVGAEVHDRRCGLHVHLDMRKRNKTLVYNNLVACQKVLMRLVDPKRHSNEFCRQVKFKRMPINFNGDRHERYKTINAVSYYKYQTLEVRMHEGSVTYTDIVGWVDLLIKIANVRKKITKTIPTLTMLKKMLKLNEKMYSYAVDRNCFWQLRGQRNNPIPRAATDSVATFDGIF